MKLNLTNPERNDCKNRLAKQNYMWVIILIFIKSSIINSKLISGDI